MERINKNLNLELNFCLLVQYPLNDHGVDVHQDNDAGAMPKYQISLFQKLINSTTDLTWDTEGSLSKAKDLCHLRK